jgi:hypothetical protein
MSPNGRMTKTHFKEWCAFKSIVRHGIVDRLLTHTLERSILNFSPLVELRQNGLKNVNVKMMMFVFIVKPGFPMMAIIVGYETQSTFFPWSIEPNT